MKYHATFLVILCAIILSACTQTKPVATEKPLANPSDTTEPVVQLPSISPIYFGRDGNLYQADALEGNEQTLTDYPKNPTRTPAKDGQGNEIPFRTFKYLSVTQTGSVGYGMCAIVTGNYGCSIYKIEQGQSTKLPVNFSPQANLQLGAFYDQDTYAYAYEESVEDGSSKWRIILQDNGKPTTLLNYAYANRFGRGGSYDDAQLMRFSPKGDFVLHVDTASPRSTLDFNLYLYPINGLSPTIIKNATQPTWVDHQTLVYRSIPSEGNPGGIYSYSLATKKSSLFMPAESSLNTSQMYWPRTSPDGQHLSFFEYNKQITYIVSTSSKQVVAEIKNAVDTHWIDDDTLYFTRTGKCTETDPCGQIPYSYRGKGVYSLTTEEVQEAYDIGLLAHPYTTFWER